MAPKQFKFAVDGNIGAGKTTLIGLLKKCQPNWFTAVEPVSEWVNLKSECQNECNGTNLLNDFYSDQHRWSYTFQSYVLLSKFRIYSKFDEVKPDSGGISVQIVDRSHYCDRFVFAKNCYDRGFMTENEWNIYLETFNYLSQIKETSKLDGIIYLQTSPSVCVERINRRGRPEEKEISEDYLNSLHELHEKLYFKNEMETDDHLKSLPLLIINHDQHYCSSDDYQSIVSQVEEFILNSIQNRN